MESKSHNVTSRRGFLKLVGLFGAAATVCGVTPLLSAPVSVPLAKGGLIAHSEELIPVKLLDGECWVPELWAKESLRILEENMVIGGIVHRDFDLIHLMNVGDVDAVVKTRYDETAKGTLITLDLLPGAVRLPPSLSNVSLG